MDRTVKLGIASLVLIVGCVLPSPLNAVFTVISCILGFLAAYQGSKWWLLVPFTIIALAAGLVYVGFRAT
jgi:F0F1-type ATP synthase assembly protein I